MILFVRFIRNCYCCVYLYFYLHFSAIKTETLLILVMSSFILLLLLLIHVFPLCLCIYLCTLPVGRIKSDSEFSMMRTYGATDTSKPYLLSQTVCGVTEEKKYKLKFSRHETGFDPQTFIIGSRHISTQPTFFIFRNISGFLSLQHLHQVHIPEVGNFLSLYTVQQKCQIYSRFK